MQLPWQTQTSVRREVVLVALDEYNVFRPVCKLKLKCFMKQRPKYTHFISYSHRAHQAEWYLEDAAEAVARIPHHVHSIPITVQVCIEKVFISKYDDLVVYSLQSLGVLHQPIMSMGSFYLLHLTVPSRRPSVVQSQYMFSPRVGL